MCVYAENINEVVLTKEEHGDKLFEIMGKLLDILTNSGYACRVYADEPGLGIYVVQYEHKNPELTTKELVWIDTEKYYISEYGADEDKDEEGDL